MYKLRPYQEEAVQVALDHFPKDKPFVIQAATGAGKSLIAAEICHRLDCPVLILQPSKELLEQNYAKLQSYGITDIGIYSASKSSKEIGKYTFATIGSIYKRPDEFKHFEYVIIDECHQVNPKNLQGMYTSFLKAIDCRKVCGLTATPYRIDQKFYTDERGALMYTAFLKMINRIPPFFFRNIVYKIETQELIEMGFLSPIHYSIEPVDLSDLRINSTGREFTEDSLECFWNDAKLRRLAEIVKEIDRTCKRNLIFCSSIRQATRAVNMLNEGGIPAALVTGETASKERERIVKEFREGKIKHLVNMGVFTTGFDVPELDAIVLARPTMSVALYYQMVGRGVRIDPANTGKILKVYDLAGVVPRLGKVESIRLAKEDDGFRDKLVSEHGDLTGVPLFDFQVTKQEKLQKLSKRAV